MSPPFSKWDKVKLRGVCGVVLVVRALRGHFYFQLATCCKPLLSRYEIRHDYMYMIFFFCTPWAFQVLMKNIPFSNFACICTLNDERSYILQSWNFSWFFWGGYPLSITPTNSMLMVCLCATMFFGHEYRKFGVPGSNPDRPFSTFLSLSL